MRLFFLLGSQTLELHIWLSLDHLQNQFAHKNKTKKIFNAIPSVGLSYLSHGQIQIANLFLREGQPRGKGHMAGWLDPIPISPHGWILFTPCEKFQCIFSHTGHVPHVACVEMKAWGYAVMFSGVVIQSMYSEEDPNKERHGYSKDTGKGNSD